MQEMYRLASELTKEWNREKFDRIFRLAIELDIFAAEMDNGICIEDDVFYYEWKQNNTTAHQQEERNRQQNIDTSINKTKPTGGGIPPEKERGNKNMGAKYTAAQAQATKRHEEKFDKITIRLPKGEREEWKAFVDEYKYPSMNDFIRDAMELYRKSIIEDCEEDL